jgi:L-malate glycosyltransferase
MNAAKPIKVIYLLDDFRGPSGGGTEVQFINLVHALDRAQVEPEIVVLRGTEYTRNLQQYPVKITTLDIRKMFSLDALVKMLRFAGRIRREKVALVQIFFNDASILAPFFCALGGAKVIASRRDMGFWYTPFNLRCLRVSNLFVDRIIANSNAIKSNVHRQEKFPLEKISVIYNGVDSARFGNLPTGVLRDQLGIKRGDPVVGMVANLDKIKRHPDLIHAFATVLGKFPDLKLVLAGQGPELAQLQELSRELQVADRVFFLGNVPNILPVIADLDIGVLCSESEGLSNAVIEYLGCGKPAICTDTGGNPELVTDGYNGYLVGVNRVGDLAARLEAILSDPELYAELSRNGKQSFHDKFDLGEMVSSHVEVYRTLLNQNS